MRPVIHAAQPRWEVDLAPQVPEGWLAGQAILIRTGDRCAMYLQMRSVEPVNGVLFALPVGYRAQAPIGGALKSGTTGFVGAHLLLASGTLTAYGAATSPSWCYWTASWDVSSPHVLPA